MTLPPSVQIAVQSLRRNALQTTLALVGLAIGVGAVLTTVALGSGAQSSIEDQVRAAGLNVIVVTAGNYKTQDDSGGGVVAHQADARPQGSNRSFESVLHPDAVPAAFHPEDNPMEPHNHPTARERLGDAEAGLGAAATLTRDDAEAIRDTIRGVQFVASGVHENARVVAGDRRWFTRLHGTDLDMPRIRRAHSLQHGRFFNRRELDRGEQVIVLGSVVRNKLFGEGSNPVGRTVTLWNQPFQIVGVTTSHNWLVTPEAGDDQFDAVYVPFTTVHHLLNLSKLNTITVTAASSGDVARIAREITELLRERHGITQAMPDDFTVRTQATEVLTKGLHPKIARTVAGNLPGLDKVTLAQLSSTLERANVTMTVLLACIAAVSLIVGGIGITNIMLLSVIERTQEIGIRLAVGARERDVRAQFAAEALALGVAGGVTGLLLGLAATFVVRNTLQWSAAITPGAVLFAFGIAVAVGLGAGFYPAKKAAQLDPIDALRYE